MGSGTAKRRGGAVRPPARPMRRGLAFFIFGLAAAGEVLALYATYIHSRIHREPGWASACAVSEGVNCDSVILSPLGSMAGIPLPILGAWFYLVIGAVTAFELWGRQRLLMRSAAVVLFTASILATTVSGGLAVVSLTSLGTLCLVCAGIYFVNIGLLVVSWSAVRSTGETVVAALKAEREHCAHYSFRSATAVVVSVAVLLAVRAAYLKGTAGGSDVCGAVAAALRTRSLEPVQVKVYSDFQCPHCKAVDRDLRDLRRGPGVRVILLHYPLDETCNPRVTRTRHPGACLQARSALCADAQGRGEEFSDGLFDEGSTRRDALVELARSLGLDGSHFERCLDAQDTMESLRRSIDEAIAADVRATPTIFVDGARHTGRLDADDLRCLRAVTERQRAGAARGAGR